MGTWPCAAGLSNNYVSTGSGFDVRTTSRILGFIMLAITASCGGGSDGGYGGVTNPGTGGGGGGGGSNPPVQTSQVAVADNQFSPGAIQVAAGATVTWTWAQNASLHNVTFTSGTSSANLSAPATFARTFPTAGTFSYQCTLHPGMSGTVTVQ
jgi:plastocyanin